MKVGDLVRWTGIGRNMGIVIAHLPAAGANENLVAWFHSSGAPQGWYADFMLELVSEAR